MRLYDLTEFMKLSAALNYQLSARQVNWDGVVRIILGEKPMAEAERRILAQMLTYVFEEYGGQRRRLGAPSVLHPIRAASLLAQVSEPPSLLDLTTALLHDNYEDIEPLGVDSSKWLSIQLFAQPLDADLAHDLAPHLRVALLQQHARVQFLSGELDQFRWHSHAVQAPYPPAVAEPHRRTVFAVQPIPPPVDLHRPLRNHRDAAERPPPAARADDAAPAVHAGGDRYRQFLSPLLRPLVGQHPQRLPRSSDQPAADAERQARPAGVGRFRFSPAAPEPALPHLQLQFRFEHLHQPPLPPERQTPRNFLLRFYEIPGALVGFAASGDAFDLAVHRIADHVFSDGTV